MLAWQGRCCARLLPSFSTAVTQHSDPPTFETQGLELAVPGTYLIGEPVVTIAAFAPQLTVITSKQRPRRLTIHGSDGAEYMFLLKGHEDLRQVADSCRCVHTHGQAQRCMQSSAQHSSSAFPYQ